MGTGACYTYGLPPRCQLFHLRDPPGHLPRSRDLHLAYHHGDSGNARPERGVKRPVFLAPEHGAGDHRPRPRPYNRRVPDLFLKARAKREMVWGSGNLHVTVMVPFMEGWMAQ